MTLGDIIKEYRTSHGLSQDIIAERSGLSKAYISILERNRNPKTGEPPIATPKTINAIALAINSDFDTIFSKLDSNLKISIGEQLPQASIPRPLPPNITALPTMKEWPVLGATACGKPLHRELLEETVMAPADIKADVVFRCVGHSMINARIFGRRRRVHPHPARGGKRTDRRGPHRGRVHPEAGICVRGLCGAPGGEPNGPNDYSPGGRTGPGQL